MQGIGAFDKENLEPLIQDLRGSKVIDRIHIVEQENSIIQDAVNAVMGGNILVDAQSVAVQIGLDQDFPESLPLIYISPANALGFIPHVDQRGNVCYTQKEGLLLNRRDPIGIIEDAIILASQVLSKGVCGENKWDFIDEFSTYLIFPDKTEKIVSLVSPDDQIRKIKAVKSPEKDDDSYLYIFDDDKSLRAFWNQTDIKHFTHRNAIYVPFKEGTFIMPPEPGKFWQAADIRAFVNSNLTKDELKTLAKQTRKYKSEEIVLFKLPRPSGGEVIFGVLFQGVARAHPLHKKSRVQHVLPIIVDRCDRAYLLPRGGASDQLQEKKVVIIGCGSVGGNIALRLAESGIINLTLIDNERILPENTFRHVLGKDSWNTSKASALKEEIQNKFPYVFVRAFNLDIKDILRNSILDLTKFDLIINALGDDTLSLMINELLYARADTPPILHLWLEPYGIGGHALLIGNNDKRGCLECLFTPNSVSDEQAFFNRAAFAAAGQSFSSDISGCSNLFTPYGALDAVQTSILGTRLAVKTLLGEVSDNPLQSWKGFPDNFLNAGFDLSDRYDLTASDLEDRNLTYKNPNCPVCGDNAGQ